MTPELKADDNNQVQNRFEIIFLYDVEDGNPNGDPVNENRPRIDETTGKNLVTDVRLKRTVRDYFIDQYDGETEKVFIRQVENDDGYLKDREELVEEALDVDSLKDVENQRISEELLRQFIDLRLFGATLSFDDAPQSFTGPTQFKMGRSLHEVDTRYIRNSVTLPGGKEKTQGTFGDRYDLPYSLIRFYGIVNETAAQHTNLDRGDVYKLADGLWNGTKSLITHSKMAHSPKMLLLVEYNEDNYHIGGLDHLIELKSDKDDEELRTFHDVDIDMTQLQEKLEEQEDKIAAVHIQSETPVNLGEVQTEELGLE